MKYRLEKKDAWIVLFWSQQHAPSLNKIVYLALEQCSVQCRHIYTRLKMHLLFRMWLWKSLKTLIHVLQECEGFYLLETKALAKIHHYLSKKKTKLYGLNVQPKHDCADIRCYSLKFKAWIITRTANNTSQNMFMKSWTFWFLAYIVKTSELRAYNVFVNALPVKSNIMKEILIHSWDSHKWWFYFHSIKL